jgi:hypothetical protein
VIDEHQRAAQRDEPTGQPPGWLAKTEAGLREQKQRYAHAAKVLRQRQAANAGRRSDKRKPADQVLVSPADPEAALARDKEGVFRPLYTVQVIRDLDSPLLFAHDVVTQVNDNGVLGPLIERLADNVGVKPKQLLVDSGYVSMRHLEVCHLAGITLYGPCQANDFSATNGKKPQSNQHTRLPKSAFTWVPEEQTYRCPEGHRLRLTGTQTNGGRTTRSGCSCTRAHPSTAKPARVSRFAPARRGRGEPSAGWRMRSCSTHCGRAWRRPKPRACTSCGAERSSRASRTSRSTAGCGGFMAGAHGGSRRRSGRWC